MADHARNSDNNRKRSSEIFLSICSNWFLDDVTANEQKNKNKITIAINFFILHNPTKLQINIVILEIFQKTEAANYY